MHQSCYGSELDNIPHESWFCKRCTFLRDNPDVDPCSVECLFCPFLTGNSCIIEGILAKIGDDIWAHVVCVNWIPDIYFIDQKHDRINYKNMNKKRFSLRCFFCRIGKGCCIKVIYLTDFSVIVKNVQSLSM